METDNKNTKYLQAALWRRHRHIKRIAWHFAVGHAKRVERNNVVFSVQSYLIPYNSQEVWKQSSGATGQSGPVFRLCNARCSIKFTTSIKKTKTYLTQLYTHTSALRGHTHTNTQQEHFADTLGTLNVAAGSISNQLPIKATAVFVGGS